MKTSEQTTHISIHFLKVTVKTARIKTSYCLKNSSREIGKVCKKQDRCEEAATKSPSYRIHPQPLSKPKRSYWETMNKPCFFHHMMDSMVKRDLFPSCFSPLRNPMHPQLSRDPSAARPCFATARGCLQACAFGSVIACDSLCVVWLMGCSGATQIPPAYRA